MHYLLFHFQYIWKNSRVKYKKTGKINKNRMKEIGPSTLCRWHSNNYWKWRRPTRNIKWNGEIYRSQDTATKFSTGKSQALIINETERDVDERSWKLLNQDMNKVEYKDLGITIGNKGLDKETT